MRRTYATMLIMLALASAAQAQDPPGGRTSRPVELPPLRIGTPVEGIIGDPAAKPGSPLAREVPEVDESPTSLTLLEEELMASDMEARDALRKMAEPSPLTNTALAIAVAVIGLTLLVCGLLWAHQRRQS